MPTIGSVELLIVILVAFIVVGPRDLPRLMRSVGQWVNQVRMMASEFQHNLDIVVKEADLDDLKNEALAIRQEAEDIRQSIMTPLSGGKPGAEKMPTEGSATKSPAEGPLEGKPK